MVITLVGIVTFMVGFIAGAIFEDYHDFIRVRDNKKSGR